MNKVKQDNSNYLLYSARLRRYADDGREQRIIEFIDQSLREGNGKKSLFMDAMQALIEKQNGEALPPKKLIVETSFDNFLALMHDIKDALRNAQTSGRVISAVDVDRFETGLSEIKEAWDTSHLGKEGAFYD